MEDKIKNLIAVLNEKIDKCTSEKVHCGSNSDIWYLAGKKDAYRQSVAFLESLLESESWDEEDLDLNTRI